MPYGEGDLHALFMVSFQFFAVSSYNIYPSSSYSVSVCLLVSSGESIIILKKNSCTQRTQLIIYVQLKHAISP